MFPYIHTYSKDNFIYLINFMEMYYAMFNLWGLIFSMYYYILCVCVCMLHSGCSLFLLIALLHKYTTIYLLSLHGHVGDFYTFAIVNHFTVILLVCAPSSTSTSTIVEP